MAIYKITNLANSKIYIGQTIVKDKRWSQHKSLLNNSSHYNKHLQAAWNKYGENSFTFEVIEQLNPELNFDLNNLERYWIKFYDSTNPDKGYNKSYGGEGGGLRTEEAKENNSLAHSRPSLEFKDTSDWKRKNRIKPKQVKKSESKSGSKNPMFGKKSPNSRQVKCRETGQIFSSLHEAGRTLNIAVQNLVHHLNGRYRRTGGLTFEYVN